MVPRKLPSELEEEILVHLRPLSLARFRAVCKEWNTLFNDKRFTNKNFALARPEFLLKTESNTYSISVNLNDDPTVKVSDLSLDIPVHIYGTCDGYLLFKNNKGSVVCNPWLRHSRWNQPVDESFFFLGIGYDNSKPEKSFKILLFTYGLNEFLIYYQRFALLELETNELKIIDCVQNLGETIVEEIHNENIVSLNGNLYWTAYIFETGQYLIKILDVSKEILKPFCILPCKKKDSSSHTRVLAVYKGDGFSLLEQNVSTSKIEIWVTKKKIINGDIDDGDDVVWIKFMTISRPKFPIFVHYRSSYLVDNSIYGKTFVMCCGCIGGKARVYVVRGDVCKKIKIDGQFCWSSVNVPSLIPITLDKENKKNY